MWKELDLVGGNKLQKRFFLSNKQILLTFLSVEENYIIFHQNLLVLPIKQFMFVVI